MKVLLVVSGSLLSPHIFFLEVWFFVFKLLARNRPERTHIDLARTSTENARAHTHTESDDQEGVARIRGNNERRHR